jgi:hypothetical protein
MTALTLDRAAQHDIVWRFDENRVPCLCCSAFTALEDGKWICEKGQFWFVLCDEPFNSWADAADVDEKAALARETSEDKRKRLEAAAAKEAMSNLSAMSYEMKTHAEIMGIKARVGVKRGAEARKIERPCKWLYCNEAAPKHLWRKNSDGKLCAPMSDNIMSACWAYEYVDPKTKVLKKPHTCPFLHPGEEGWCVQWATNKHFDAQASAVQNRFSVLKGSRGA